MAEQNNPTLAQAAARVQAAQGEWLQSGLHPNPRAGYQASEIGDEEQAGQQGGIFGPGVGHGRQAGTGSRSGRPCRSGRPNGPVRRSGSGCKTTFAARFYDVLVAQRSVELTDQLVRIGQEGVRAAEELLKAKEVARVDVLQARIEADSAQNPGRKGRQSVPGRLANSGHCGRRGRHAAGAAGGRNAGRVDADYVGGGGLGRVMAESPVLAEARSGVARAEAVLSRQCAERMPNVDLQAGVLYDNATRDTIAEVQAGVPLPLFNRNQGNIRKAEAELAVARADVRRAELELQQRLAAAFEQYQNARCQVEKYAGRHSAQRPDVAGSGHGRLSSGRVQLHHAA